MTFALAIEPTAITNTATATTTTTINTATATTTITTSSCYYLLFGVFTAATNHSSLWTSRTLESLMA